MFNFRVVLDPPGAPNIKGDVVDELIARVERNECVQAIDNEAMHIAIADARLVPSGNDPRAALAMLFDLTDPNASIASNRNIVSRQLRHFETEEDEGRAQSAHLLLKLDPDKKDGVTFRAVLEQSQGLGRSRVTPHLQRTIKSIFKDLNLKVQNADGVPVRVMPTVSLTPVRDERLGDADDSAEIASLVLIDNQIDSTSFDAPPGTKPKSRTYRLKAEKPAAQSVADFLSGLRPWAKANGFKRFDVQWRPTAKARTSAAGAAPERPARAKIDIDNDDFAETLFATKRFIKLDHPMSDCVEELRDEMVIKMHQLI